MKIIGLKKIKNKSFNNSKGNLLKFITKKNKFLKSFGEIYFNEIRYKKTKGWILHKKNQCLITVCHGEVIFKLIDGRKKSKSFNKVENIKLSSIKNNMIVIPPGIWFSFTTNLKKSVICNLMNNPHSDEEVIKSSKIKNFKIV